MGYLPSRIYSSGFIKVNELQNLFENTPEVVKLMNSERQIPQEQISLKLGRAHWDAP
jgi:hypothetical protein